MATAGSDSENEGVLTNIQRKVIRPPGHTGKARKGHMCFDGSHETMNLGKVGFITDQEYDIYIRPDSANPRNRSGGQAEVLAHSSSPSSPRYSTEACSQQAGRPSPLLLAAASLSFHVVVVVNSTTSHTLKTFLRAL